MIFELFNFMTNFDIRTNPCSTSPEVEQIPVIDSLVSLVFNGLIVFI